MMNKIYVMFSGPDESEIVMTFSDRQDPTIYKNQGEVYPDDPRWGVYYARLPNEAAKAYPTPT